MGPLINFEISNLINSLKLINDEWWIGIWWMIDWNVRKGNHPMYIISSYIHIIDIETILDDFHVSFTWMKYNYLRNQKKVLIAEGFIYLYIFSIYKQHSKLVFEIKETYRTKHFCPYVCLPLWLPMSP